jgi:hypothetical protein
MKKILLIAAGVVLGLFVLVLIGAWLFLSPEWEVTRTRKIEAPISAIHATVADLHSWPEWTAWGREADPEAVWSFEGAPAGTGAVMRWSGPRFGQGRLTILKADPTGIEYEVAMENGKQNPVQGRITYRPVEGGTQLTWTDRSEFGGNPLLRVFKSFFEKAMGGAVEKGLESLAERLEDSGP